jgi:hypothetical protein
LQGVDLLLVSGRESPEFAPQRRDLARRRVGLRPRHRREH